MNVAASMIDGDEFSSFDGFVIFGKPNSAILRCVGLVP